MGTDNVLQIMICVVFCFDLLFNELLHKRKQITAFSYTWYLSLLDTPPSYIPHTILILVILISKDVRDFKHEKTRQCIILVTNENLIYIV